MPEPDPANHITKTLSVLGLLAILFLVGEARSSDKSDSVAFAGPQVDPGFFYVINATQYVREIAGRWCNPASSLWLFEDMIVLGNRAYWASYQVTTSGFDDEQDLVVNFSAPENASFRIRLQATKQRLIRFYAWGDGSPEILYPCARRDMQVQPPPSLVTRSSSGLSDGP